MPDRLGNSGLNEIANALRIVIHLCSEMKMALPHSRCGDALEAEHDPSLLFHEYFHGDTAPAGRESPDGWTVLIAKLIQQQAPRTIVKRDPLAIYRSLIDHPGGLRD